MDAHDLTALAGLADRLRALHRPGQPLVLVNVWDAASARQVAAAGAAAVATSSAAIATSLGVPDDDTMGPLAFEALRRVADAVDVPVSADLEAGYGLSGDDLVDGLLGAGAVGCNIEDSDHRRPGHLVDAEVAAARLADIRAAATRRGVEVVLNARTDVLIHGGTDRDPATVAAEIVRRGRLYLDAGADCVYPVQLIDATLVAKLVAELGAPLNANAGSPAGIAEMAAARASRVSMGPMPQRQLMADFGERAAELLS